jgi:hypothetical protein
MASSAWSSNHKNGVIFCMPLSPLPGRAKASADRVAALGLHLVKPRRAGQVHRLRRKSHEVGVAAAGLVLAVEALALAAQHRLGRDLVAYGSAQATAAKDPGHWMLSLLAVILAAVAG